MEFSPSELSSLISFTGLQMKKMFKESNLLALVTCNGYLCLVLSAWSSTYVECRIVSVHALDGLYYMEFGIKITPNRIWFTGKYNQTNEQLSDKRLKQILFITHASTGAL